MPRDLLPIGSFASRCRLSVKALRHYDELGLLRPAHVDVATQYRYYDRRQAPAAIAIALLRSLDVPLPAIRDVLASEDPEAVTRILDRERERRARDIARAETALRSIERLIRAGTALARTLLDRLDRLGRTLIGPVICLLPPASDETVILQMCTPIADPPPGERVMTLPAGSVAVARQWWTSCTGPATSYRTAPQRQLPRSMGHLPHEVTGSVRSSPGGESSDRPPD